jgi:hypothetical protein
MIPAHPRAAPISLFLMVIGARGVAATPQTDSSQLVVIGTAADEPLIGRVVAELKVIGIPVNLRLVEATDEERDPEIDRALRDGARAVVRVVSRAGRIEVVIADPTTRAVVLRQVLEGEPSEELDSVLAIRAVEFVRAMLLGHASKSAPVASTPAAAVPAPVQLAPALETPSRSTQPALGIAVVSGFAAAAGGLGAQAELGARVRVRFGGAVGFELAGLAPLTSEAVPGDAATNARASFWLAGGGLYGSRRVGRLGGVELGAGGLAVVLRVKGDPAAGWNGNAQTQTGAAAYGRLGGNIALSRVLALRADLLVGGAFRRPVASAGGPGLYPWGYAFGAALAGIEARWF